MPSLRSSAKVSAGSTLSPVYVGPPQVAIGDEIVFILGSVMSPQTYTPPDSNWRVIPVEGVTGGYAGAGFIKTADAGDVANGTGVSYQFGLSARAASAGEMRAYANAKAIIDYASNTAFGNGPKYLAVLSRVDNPIVFAGFGMNAVAPVYGDTSQKDPVTNALIPDTTPPGWDPISITTNGTGLRFVASQIIPGTAAGSKTPLATFALDASHNWSSLAVLIYDASANLSPVLSLTGPQFTVAGAPINVTATASDVDGSIASYLHQVTSPNAANCQILNPTSATCQVAPARDINDMYEITTTVTDNQGAQTSSKTMVINIKRRVLW